MTQMAKEPAVTTPTTETGVVEPWAERDADGLDRVEALVSDASAVEGICNVHEGAGYYAERIIKRAIAQGSLCLPAIAAMPDSTQLLQTMAGALEAFAKVTAAYDYWCAEVMPDFTYPVGTRLESAIQDCPAAIGQLTRSDFERAKAALAQFRAQEQRS